MLGLNRTTLAIIAIFFLYLFPSSALADDRRVCRIDKKDDPKSVVQACRRLISGKSSSNEKYQFYLSEGRGWENMRRHPEAVESFSSAIMLNPEREDGYRFRGIAYSSKGEINKCIADERTAIAKARQIGGVNEGSYVQLALCYKENTQASNAVETAELNVVLGVSQLHLNFAGIDSHGRRPRRDLPGETLR